MKAFERIKTMTINEKALELHEKWNGIAANGPILPSPRTALPSETTATVLDLMV